MNGTISLRAARIDAGVTQRAAGEVAGVSARTISAWEVGKTCPTGLQLLRLCEFYGRTLDEIRLPEKSR